jgi:hypothetical protein
MVLKWYIWSYRLNRGACRNRPHTATASVQIRVERIGLVIITVKDKGHFGRAKRIVGIKEKIETEMPLATL